MRSVVRGIIAVFLSLVWLLAAILVWLNYSTTGLPDIGSLQAYAPGTTTLVPASHCVEALQAARPVELQNLYPALAAAEGDPQKDLHSTQIARSMVCSPMKNLPRMLLELRIALQVRRKFSPRCQQAIYLNRSYFAEGGRGIASASKFYFGVSPSHLDAAQSALLTGMIRNATYYSPITHPDRALARRNQVLDQMATQGSLTPSQAAASKALPLELKPDSGK